MYVYVCVMPHPLISSPHLLPSSADVVDSTDGERMAEANEELQSILADPEMRDCVVLILANKQDLPRALSPADISSKLGLRSITKHRWYIQPTCGCTGEGLFEGLDWIGREMRNHSNFRSSN